MTGWLRVCIGLGLLTAGIVVGRYTATAGNEAAPAHPAAMAAGGAGATSPSWEATVYLPLADNQGQPFPDEVWRQALDVLVVHFGGATLGPPLEGCWLDTRQRVRREPVRPVVVSFDHQRLAAFRAAVREVGQRLGQEVVYIRFDRPHVELVPVGSPNPDTAGAASLQQIE